MRAGVYIRGLGTPTASRHIFESEKLSQICLVLLTEPVFGSGVRRSTHPITTRACVCETLCVNYVCVCVRARARVSVWVDVRHCVNYVCVSVLRVCVRDIVCQLCVCVSVRVCV